MNPNETVLAIESSCDESAIAIFDAGAGVLKSLVHTQIDLHALYGGVVPDLASSEHLKNLPLLVESIVRDSYFEAGKIDKIVCTSGPGLANCLAMGIASAAALALYLKKPLFGANHLRGHAYSPFISEHARNPGDFKRLYFDELLPHLGLLVSGGNSILFEISKDGKMRTLCETLDDAAGEALDKGAKLLGMPYPGAPMLERAALGGDRKKFPFPRGSARKPEDDPDFSFSGLKTSLRYFLERRGGVGSDLADICASYQYAVFEQLRKRVEYFLGNKRYKSFGLSGGVANNSTLRESLKNSAARAHCKFLPAEKKYCGDNAAMIAFSAWIDPTALAKSSAFSLSIEPSRPLAEY